MFSLILIFIKVKEKLLFQLSRSFFAICFYFSTCFDTYNLIIWLIKTFLCSYRAYQLIKATHIIHIIKTYTIILSHDVHHQRSYKRLGSHLPLLPTLSSYCSSICISVSYRSLSLKASLSFKN